MIRVDTEAPFATNFAHIQTPLYAEDDEGAEHLCLYYVSRETTDEEVAEWVEQNHPAERCTHSHDCCGQLYAGKPRYWRVPHAERLVVFISYSRNI